MRPVPVPDETSAPYWTAAAEHRLVLPHCAVCGTAALPPAIVCPSCGTTEPAWGYVPASGKGTVRSWTIVRQAFLPGFDDDLPFLLVDVQLDDEPGIRMIGRLLDGPDAPLRIGDAVDVAFEDVADGVAVPAFVLSS